MKIKLYAFICAVLLCFVTVVSANHFIVVGGGCGPLLIDDPANTDNTASWSKLDATLSFDTDHYVFTRTNSTQYISQKKTTIIGQRYIWGYEFKDGTATGETLYGKATNGSGNVYDAAIATESFGESNGVWQSGSLTFTAQQTSTYIIVYANFAEGNIHLRNLKCACL